jgi:Tol biopolymer transport system component
MLQFFIGCLLMVCSEPGEDGSPADWWIGFSESRNDHPEGQFANWITRRAYIVRADGSQRRAIGAELADKEHSWTQFAGWSPDGRHAIIYSSWEDPANAQWEREHKTFRMTEGWLVDSCLVDIRNGSVRNLTAIDRVSIYNTGLFFLPQGKGYGFTALINGISKPFQMDLNGGNKQDVSGGGSGFSYGYSASPDGSRISYHEDYQVYIANADGSDKQRIETGNSFNFVPQWSPDGQWLMFLSGEHYNCHPHIVKKDGTGLRKLADRGGYRGVVEVLKHPDFHSESSDVPVWAPDSQSIYYSSKIGDSIELMHADLEGNSNQLTHSKTGTRHYHPTVSPNGKWILFGSDRSGTMQLYVASLDKRTFDDESLWPITNVPEGHCAMHGSWQNKPSSSDGPSDPEIVTVAKSASDYTRKSEGDVIELSHGRLLLVYMEFAGDGSDFAKTRLVSQESSDGGRSWGRHRVITETESGDLNVYSPSLIRALNGGILLVFMRQHRPGTLTNHVWKSMDEGETFTPLSEFVPRQDFSLCNGTIKRLSSGRLLLPASPPQPGKPAETGPYSATTLYSDDDGLTWHVSPSRIALPKRGAMEPHVEETGDGRVLMVMRNQLGKLYFSESSDEGATWSAPWASDLITPESCPELTRIPGTGDLLMIWNHQYDASFRSHYGKRSPLTCAISKDDGKTWQSVRDIETDPNRAFSNPSCRFTRDGKAIVNYWTCEYLPDWRMQDVIDLRVAVINAEWFYGGKSSK